MMDGWFGASFAMGHPNARKMFTGSQNQVMSATESIKSTVDFISKSNSVVEVGRPMPGSPMWSITVNARFGGVSQEGTFEALNFNEVVNGAIGWANQKRAF